VSRQNSRGHIVPIPACVFPQTALITTSLADGQLFFQEETIAHGFVLFSDGSVHDIPAGLPPETLRGLITGDREPWEVDAHFRQVRQQTRLRIHWANCTALAVLILSYAVLLFRPRDKRPPGLTEAAEIPA